MNKFSCMKKGFVHFILLLGTAIVITPFLWMILTSFKTAGEAVKIPPVFFPSRFQFAHYLKSRILHQDSLDAMLDTLKQYFDKMPEERVLKQSFFADT